MGVIEKAVLVGRTPAKNHSRSSTCSGHTVHFSILAESFENERQNAPVSRHRGRILRMGGGGVCSVHSFVREIVLALSVRVPNVLSQTIVVFVCPIAEFTDHRFRVQVHVTHMV
jgi:hypothetical protein